MTAQAQHAIAGADVVIGYSGYFVGLEDLVAGKETIALPLTQETRRAELAVEHAAGGQDRVRHLQRRSGRVRHGQPGAGNGGKAYGRSSRPELVVVPGISAVNACASLLGAPIAHDFAVISLSDLLTPWSKIERRLAAAAEADFVIALYNPQSQRRAWQYPRRRRSSPSIARATRRWALSAVPTDPISRSN